MLYSMLYSITVHPFQQGVWLCYAVGMAVAGWAMVTDLRTGLLSDAGHILCAVTGVGLLIWGGGALRGFQLWACLGLLVAGLVSFARGHSGAGDTKGLAAQVLLHPLPVFYSTVLALGVMLTYRLTQNNTTRPLLFGPFMAAGWALHIVVYVLLVTTTGGI